MQYGKTLIMALALLFGGASWADDLDDLKAADEAALKAWNTRDVEALFDIVHTQAIGFWSADKVPTLASSGDIKADKARMKAWFDEREEYSIEKIKPDYRVIGTTGIVCGFYRTRVKLKGKPAQTRPVTRSLNIFVKESGGKWRQVAWHSSPVPQSPFPE